MSNWVSQAEDRYKKLVQIREQLFIQTFTNAQLKQLNLTDAQSIIEKQKKRLNVKDSRITLQQLRLRAIENGDNLYNLIKNKKAKILSTECTQYQFKLKIQVFQPLKLSIQKGTLMFPCDNPDKTQKLIIKDQLRQQMKAGVHLLNLETFCYNSQLKAPRGQQYLLGNIQCLQFSSDLNQSQVWEITVKKRQLIQHLEGELKKKDYIALTKKKFHQLIQEWN